MAIVSTELRQVFRAYTKQLSGEYARAKSSEQATETRARGFERVEISQEARALAAAGLSQPKTKDGEPSKSQRTSGVKAEDDVNTSENDALAKAEQPDAEIKK